jgi:hypothetical protein
MDSMHSTPAGGAASPFRRPPRPPASRPSPPVAAAPLAATFGPVPAEPLTAPAPRPAAPAAPAPAQPAEAGATLLERQRRNGALWFYWIAGLSLVNTVAALVHQSWRFILGLGITQLADSLAARSGHGHVVVAVVDVLVIGGFALIGRFAQRGHVWAFVAGGIFYALDGLLFLAERDWVAVGFHVFVLVMIARGFDAARRLA